MVVGHVQGMGRVRHHHPRGGWGLPDVPGSEHAADATAGSGRRRAVGPRVIDGTEGPDFEALEAMLTAYQLDGFVSGALRSDYQRNRLERLGEALGLRTWTPLWHQRPEDHLRGLAAHGFEVMVTSVSAEGLDASWLGRVLDHDALDELEALSKVHRFNVDGEGGEYATMVVRAPMFPEGLDVTWTPVWEGRRGHLEMA